MTGRLEGKRIIVTGAVSNIGKAAVDAFVREGGKVVVGDINVALGQKLQSELGRSAHFIECDVTEEASIKRLIAEGAEWLGGLDALCQNAGLQTAGRIVDFSREDWDRTFAVNVRSQFFGAKHAVPFLKVAGGGSIVNTASVAGKRGGPGSTAYAASKGAVITFSATLAVELAPDNIRVNAVCPGWVDTPFNQPAIDLMGGREVQNRLVENSVPMKRQGRPAEIAPLFVYLVADESAYVTAQALCLDGGLTS